MLSTLTARYLNESETSRHLSYIQLRRDLRSGAPPSEVRTFKAIRTPDGDFKRDIHGNAIIGRLLRTS